MSGNIRWREGQSLRIDMVGSLQKGMGAPELGDIAEMQEKHVRVGRA